MVHVGSPVVCDLGSPLNLGVNRADRILGRNNCTSGGGDLTREVNSEQDRCGKADDLDHYRKCKNGPK